ncbi:MAG TPA: DUF2520 domain-containing protein [Bacteroidales bacterium]|nr:DUF2520 domain-containing protein [Bacteroidales bacterium]HNZ42908.1 DUF2520 domain-containing protein [Bacteroidales bacterium]HOH83486.1 DUF2520 domain-containing protein [Bacteroidales bacterium]HPB25140.1 DUF2520 domain-containing protein [Bacteroidales bacterium]HPI30011.1 DUF2520 domain-containing protein [Bacteroidales bacterium]
MKAIQDIVIIGAGNVAVNLAHAFRKAGKNIRCIYSRDAARARHLANSVGADFTDKFEMLPNKADLFLIAVTDSAIAEVADKLSSTEGIVAHTSGSVAISVLNKRSAGQGVFYPLIHLSSENIIDFTTVPLCLEATTEKTMQALWQLAGTISEKVFSVTSDDRKILHLAAVFACNFTNLNYIIAEEILKKNGLPFELLHPLIAGLARKIQTASPSTIMTGPAIREDYEVIAAHLNMLESIPHYQEIYQMLTKTIIQKKKNNEL